MMLEDPWSYYVGGAPEENHELLLREYIKEYEITGHSLKTGGSLSPNLS